MNNLLNSIKLKGTFVDYSYSHSYLGAKYYRGLFITRRLSGTEDCIPIVFKEDVEHLAKQHLGKVIAIVGDIRTMNHKDETTGKSSLDMYVYTSFIPYETDSEDDVNIALYRGFVCKQPQSRTTNRNYHITSLILAVKGKAEKSYYVPTITFFAQSLFAKDLNVGDEVQVFGRFQSRKYTVSGSAGTYVSKVAYEVVANEIKLIEGEN